MKFSISSRSVSTFGRPPTIASMITPKLVCSCVCLYRLLRMTSPTSPRFRSMAMRIPSRSDSSRMSEMPSMVFSRTSSAMRSISFALFT